jgi:2-polyprenyl-6-methoxyphenol hydroxylase-like FAD-dependent oxidoreductase
LVTDLVGTSIRDGGDARFRVRDVRLQDLETDRPAVTYKDSDTDRPYRIDCDFVAGCDGARGVSRSHLPEGSRLMDRPRTRPPTRSSPASCRRVCGGCWDPRRPRRRSRRSISVSRPTSDASMFVKRS